MEQPDLRLEALKEKEANLKDKIERRIPKTFSKPTQAEALERAKASLAEVQAAIREHNKGTTDVKKPSK